MNKIPFSVNPHFVLWQLTILQTWCLEKDIRFYWEHKFRIQLRKGGKRVYVNINLLDCEFYLLDKNDDVREILYSVDQVRNWLEEKIC